MGFLDETGLARVWVKIKSEFASMTSNVNSKFTGLSDQIAKSYSGTATEAIPKGSVFFSNNVLRVALTNIASGDAITDTNSQITKISNLLGGANMSETLKSVYVSSERLRYNTTSGVNSYPDNDTAKSAYEVFGIHPQGENSIFRAPAVSGYKFLTWELPRTTENSRYGEMKDGTNAAVILGVNYNSSLKAIAIYVRA